MFDTDGITTFITHIRSLPIKLILLLEHEEIFKINFVSLSPQEVPEGPAPEGRGYGGYGGHVVSSIAMITDLWHVCK